MQKTCLDCGMEVGFSTANCPKCDAVIAMQTDGSILRFDIAHNRETIPQSLAKLSEALDEARLGHARALRVIVGRGQIRDEVIRQLSWLKHNAEIMDFDHDNGNTGALLVTIRGKSF